MQGKVIAKVNLKNGGGNMMRSINLGESLKAWMNVKGVSRKDLIERTGLDAKTIKNMRDNEFWGLTKNYFAVCDALGITFAEFVLGPEYITVPIIRS